MTSDRTPATCAAQHCNKAVKAGQLMCSADWYALPRDLRNDVNAAWRRLSGELTPENLQAHRRAKTAAIAFLAERYAHVHGGTA